jgi:hypothetical protein
MVKRQEITQLTRQDAEDFLSHEAELLDQRRFEDWLKLFTEDGIYWIPVEDGTDPLLEPSILYDDSLFKGAAHLPAFAYASLCSEAGLPGGAPDAEREGIRSRTTQRGPGSLQNGLL